MALLAGKPGNTVNMFASD